MNGSSRVATATTHAAPGDEGYYGVPVIHGPHWKWLVIGYFFCGGVSGSSAAIASMARLFGGPVAAPTARLATYVSGLALAPCPILLILDLGRPSRFLNMVRTVRPSSPMSVGTWGVALFGGLTAASIALQVAVDLTYRSQHQAEPAPLRAMRVLALPHAVGGLFVAGYTGVLLAATAVPLWAKRPQILGPLFLASAMSSGSAAIAAATALRGPYDRRAEEQLEGLEATSMLAEASLFVAWVASLGPTAAPLMTGSTGYVARGGVALGIVAPSVISALSRLLPKRARRAGKLLASALTLGGVLALRYVVVVGGRESANDPAATFELAR